MAKTRKNKSLEDKVRDLDEGFVQEMLGGTKEQINAKILSMAKYAAELDEAKKNDQDLLQKKEAYSVANSSYSEPLKAIKLKTKYAFAILAQKGHG